MFTLLLIFGAASCLLPIDVTMADCRILCRGFDCHDDTTCDTPTYRCIPELLRCCKNMCTQVGYSQACVDQVSAYYSLCMPLRSRKEFHGCCHDKCQEGIDVSHHQKAIDWAQVGQSGKVQFAFIKATEGSDHADEFFVANWEGARSNGIQPHAYHYFLGAHPPGVQLANINRALQLVDFSQQQNILAIDVEKDHNVGINSTIMANKLWQLLVLLKPADLRVFIYTNRGYWDSSVDWRLHPFTDYTLWFTKWLTTDLNDRYTMDPSGSMPQPWDRWDLWQYTNESSVPGVKGPVDMDRGFCRN